MGILIRRQSHLPFGPIVPGNILIGRALFFGFVPLVIKFPTGLFFFIFLFQQSGIFTLSEKRSLGCSRLINKLHLLLSFLESGCSENLHSQ